MGDPFKHLRMCLEGRFRGKVVRLLETLGDVLVTTNIWCEEDWDPKLVDWVKKQHLRPLNEMETIAAGAL